MNELEPELFPVAQRVAEQIRRAPWTPSHRARLREELLQRHTELLQGRAPNSKSFRDGAPTTGTPTGMTGIRHWRVQRRVSVAVPPLLAIAAAFVLLVFGVGPNGQQTAPSAEAARITQALARTVPTVTGFQFTLHQERAGAERLRWLVQSLQGRRLYLRKGRVFVFANGVWSEISLRSSFGNGLQPWQWAFVSLPWELAHNSFAVLPDRTIDGRRVVGLRYTLLPRAQTHIVVTAWVDRNTGLLVRLERDEMTGSSVLERDYADYSYGRRG